MNDLQSPEVPVINPPARESKDDARFRTIARREGRSTIWDASKHIQSITDQKEWKGWLRVNLGLEGQDLENASILLASLGRGVSDIHKYHVNKRGLKYFALPSIEIVENVDIGIAYGNKTGTIRVNKEYLLRDLNKDINKPATDRAVFRGSIKQFWQYGGAEECDHAAFMLENPKYRDKFVKWPNPDDFALPVYDAFPHEFRALQAQLWYAKKLNDRELIKYYEGRIQDAQAFLNDPAYGAQTAKLRALYASLGKGTIL